MVVPPYPQLSPNSSSASSICSCHARPNVADCITGSIFWFVYLVVVQATVTSHAGVPYSVRVRVLGSERDVRAVRATGSPYIQSCW